MIRSNGFRKSEDSRYTCGSGKKFKYCCQGKDTRAQFPLSAIEGPSLLSADGHKLQSLARAAKSHWDAGR